MDGAHPEELDLLAYVEDDLPADRRASVAEHVAGCPACADAVRQLETARHVLRSAPLLELPEERRSAVLAGLRERPTRRRRLGWRPRVLVPALATAAVAAFVAGIALTVDWNGGGGEEAADSASPTMLQEDSGGQTEPPEAEAGENRTSALDAVLSVEGPPGEVARFLRRQGFDARVVDSTVRVRNARPGAVMRALADRPSGPIVVEVVP
jgi:anti-sigma factor RsiW